MSKEIITFCPLCKNKLAFNINENLVNQTTRFPKAFTFEHCEHDLIIYIDAQFKVRGVDIAFKTETHKDLKSFRFDEKQNIMIDKFITKDFIDSKPIEERIFYKFNSTNESIKHHMIPDLLERQLLSIVQKNNEISLDSLIKKASYLEDALNIKLNSSLLQKSLEKFVSENVIIKHIIDYKESL